MHSELKDRNFKISEKTVRKKMQEFNLNCEIRRRKKSKNYEKKPDEIKETIHNELNRNFHTTKPNQKYCTDMTILETKHNSVYCSIIIDLFNFQPFGLKFSTSCNAKLAEESLNELKNQRDIAGAIFHSDQGVTYKNKEFSNLLKSSKTIQSMSKKGCPYDNCLMENFWGTLKVEKIYRLKYKPENIDELKKIVEDYLEFYVNERKHSALGYLTPMQYYDNYIKSLKN